MTTEQEFSMHEYENMPQNGSGPVTQLDGLTGFHDNRTIMNTTMDLSIQLEFYLNGVVAVCVIFLGLVGNCLTVVVLTRKTMRSSTNFFLTGLALWDMMVLLCTLLLMTLSHFSASYKEIVQPYIVVYIYPLALVAQTSTVWITVSFTVERYIAVCHPLKAARMCSINRARIVIISVSVVSFLYNMTRWFEYEIFQLENDNSTGMTSAVNFRGTELGNNILYNKIYYSFYLFIMFVIPLSSLAIFNTCLIHAVKKSQKQQKDMNVRQSRENNVTIMLVSVVIVFMMCQVPAAVYNVAYAIDLQTVKTRLGWSILSTVRNFLVTFNSAINFLLYCAFGQKFRRIFMRTFCQCFLSENDFNSITYHGTVAFTDPNKKYRILMNKSTHRKDQIEMSSNITQNTIVPKYSPHIQHKPSKEGKRLLAKFQNGKHDPKTPNHHQQLMFKDDPHRETLLINSSAASSRTASPI